MRVLAFLSALALVAVQCVDATTYYVSVSIGNDRNPGTSPTRPWKTMNPVYARTYAWLPGDIILFCRGDNWMYSNLFGFAQATAENPITFGSYKCGESDELPLISPAISLAPINWVTAPSNPQLLQYNFARDADTALHGITAVWVGGERRLRARSPSLVNGKDTTIQAYSEFYVATPSTVNNGLILSTNITQPENYWQNATIYMRTNNWTYQQSKILSSGPGWIQTETWPYSNLCGGFYIENIAGQYAPLLQVDAPGEWVIDSRNGMFYYMPVDAEERAALTSGTKQLSFIYGNVSPAVVITGTGWVIQDIHIKFSPGGIINSGTSRALSAYRNKIDSIAGFGIQSSRAPGAQILDNIIDDADADCIWLDSANGMISGNRVTRCGIHAGYGFNVGGTSKGITAYQADVIGNYVSHIGYSGIEPHIGSDVKYNEISNVLLTLNDGGGIYMFGTAGDGLLLEGNIISNVVGNWLTWTPWNIASCVFTDEGTSRINIYNNTCTAAPQCMQMNRANGNVILSNKCNSPGIYLNNGNSGGGHVVIGNQITTSGTSSTLQNPISRINSPGSTSLSGVSAFYNNVYCQQATNGNYLWQTDFGQNGVSRYFSYNDWVYSECKGQSSCYFEMDSGYYYGNCDSRQPYFFTNDIHSGSIAVDQSSSINTAVIIGVVVSVVIVLVAIVAAVMYMRAKKQSVEQSVEHTLASLPNGMLPVVAPLHIRTSSTSSIDYEQYSSPMNHCTPPSFPSPARSPNRSDIELSPQYVLHKSSSAPIASQ